MWPNPQFPAGLLTFTEEILHGKLCFLCSVLPFNVLCPLKAHMKVSVIRKKLLQGIYNLFRGITRGFNSTSIYLSKINKKRTTTMCEICSKLTLKSPEWRDIAMVSLLFTLNRFRSLHCFFNFEQVNANCEVV